MIDKVNATSQDLMYFKNQLCKDENNTNLFNNRGKLNNIEGMNRYMNIM
jgi:hypothetical protein